MGLDAEVEDAEDPVFMSDEDLSAAAVPHDDPPNYIMFAITFAVIAYSVYLYLQKKKKKARGGGRRATGAAAPAAQQPPARTGNTRQERYFNGGVGAGGGGSGTMVEAPPDAGDSQGGGAAAGDTSPEGAGPIVNDTRAVSKLLGPLLLRGSSSSSVRTGEELKHARIVGLYFSAHWCPPCRAFTPTLVKCYNAIQRTHGAGQFEVIFISSDRTEEDFAKYFAEMPWLAVAFKDSAQRQKIGRDFGVRSLPTLLLISPSTGKQLAADGRAKVAADPSGKKFPWGVVDPSGGRRLFSGGGHSLSSGGGGGGGGAGAGGAEPSSPRAYSNLSRKERAAMIAERAAARKREARARAKKEAETAAAAAAAAPAPAPAPAAAGGASPADTSATTSQVAPVVETTKAASAAGSGDKLLSSNKKLVIKSVELEGRSADDQVTLLDHHHHHHLPALRIDEFSVAPHELAAAANAALTRSGAGASTSFDFTFGGVAVHLLRDTTSGALSLRLGDSSEVHPVEEPSAGGGVELHLSPHSICVGSACVMWPTPPSIVTASASISNHPGPHGDVGGGGGNSETTTPSSAASRSDGSNKGGRGPLRPGRTTGGKDLATPAWVRGEMEAPAGTRTEAGFTRGVFTPEQQQRLGVDENGQPRATIDTKKKVDPSDAARDRDLSSGVSTSAGASASASTISYTRWQPIPSLEQDDFLQPGELEDDQPKTTTAPPVDDYECPIGVRHIVSGMTELSQYLRDAEAHGLAVMVDYYATWCGPCRAIAPFYEELAATYAGKMIFLKVDCGGRGPGAINQDVKRFAQIQAFPTFHVYKSGEKVGEVRGGRREELSDLAARFAQGGSGVSGGGGGGAKGKKPGPTLRTAYSVHEETFQAKKLSVVASGATVPPANAKPLTTAVARKLIKKLTELADKNVFPFEVPLDIAAVEALCDGCLSQNLFWHTPSTSLSKPAHVAGIAEVARGLLHTVEPGARPWWQLEHVFPLLHLVEAIFLHPESRHTCDGRSGSKTNLYDAVLFTAERFCCHDGVVTWLGTGVGRATCERLLSCLTLMAAPNDLAVDSAAPDNCSAEAFPWLTAAQNAPTLIKLAQRLVDILARCKGTEDEPCAVKNYDRLLRDAARLLYNLSALLLRTPLRLKRSAEGAEKSIRGIIDASLEVVLQLQTLSVATTKLPPPVIDGQVFALRAACTALVQTNGVFPVHPEMVKRGVRTRSGLPAATAQQIWADSRNKILQRAITSVTKSANHLNKEAEEEHRAVAGQAAEEPRPETGGEAAAAAAKKKSLSLPELLKQVSRDAVALMTQTAPHPGQNTRPLPNPWASE